MHPTITMTLAEVTQILGQHGMAISPTRLADGIEDGHYPFGRLVTKGPAGRRKFEIFRVHFYAWLRTMLAEDALPQ